MSHHLTEEYWESLGPNSPLYCITPALNGYVTLPDRTPQNWMMTSLNICSMDFSTTCGQSIPLADTHEAWLSSTDLATLAQPVALIIVEERWINVAEETNNRDL